MGSGSGSKRKPIRKNQRARTAILCVAVSLLTVLYWMSDDRRLAGAWITIAPPVVWFVLLLPSAVRVRSKLFFLLLVGFLVVTTERPRLRTSAGTRPDTLRLVTWNIGAGNAGWAAPLRSLEPDLVLVQESSKPLEVWDDFEWLGTLDPGVLTRFPAEVLRTERVGPWTDPQLLLVEFRDVKILVANVRLMLPSAVIQIVNPLEESPSRNHRARVEQYEKLAALLRSTAEEQGVDAIVLGGDFNVPARMRSLDPLRAFLRDAWLEAGEGWGATVPEFLPMTRIDQVWVSDNVEVVSVRTARVEGSDHLAVVAELAPVPRP